MADKKQLNILKKGVIAWNEWRENTHHSIPIDLSHANLSNLNLVGFDFRWADLTNTDFSNAKLSVAYEGVTKFAGAILNGAKFENSRMVGMAFEDSKLINTVFERVDLSNTVFRSAILNNVEFSEVDLSHCDFAFADLSNAKLSFVNLHKASLYKTIVTELCLYETIISAVHLNDTIGLNTCIHQSRSYIDGLTFHYSEPLPNTFLRGCGLSDWEIESTKYYAAGLTNEQIIDIGYRIISLLTNNPIQYNSCFISYSSSDEQFAQKLYNDLQNNGIRCWFAPKDMKTGDKIRITIDRAIQHQENS